MLRFCDVTNLRFDDVITLKDRFRLDRDLIQLLGKGRDLLGFSLLAFYRLKINVIYIELLRR